MTLHGKCETCRKRKVKCDEKRPTCGACIKKGRTCYYSKSQDSIFVYQSNDGAFAGPSASTPDRASTPREVVESESDSSSLLTWRLKRFRKAEHGPGEYLTFGQIRQPIDKANNAQQAPSTISTSRDFTIQNLRSSPSSPTQVLLDPQTSLASKWASVFGFDALDLNPLGAWLKAAWLCEGEDLYLDLAGEYALESMLAFHQRDRVSSGRVYTKGARALESLQVATNARKGVNFKNLIVAVMLHYAAEHFVEVGSWYYVLHLLAATEFLKNYPTSAPQDDVIRNIVSLLCVDEVLESIFQGRNSAFEDLEKPHLPDDGSCQLDVALLAVEFLLVKVPRLVLAVRLTVQKPNNAEARVKAIDLAEELYNSETDRFCARALRLYSRTISTEENIATSPITSVIEFDSLSAFVLATRYYFFRGLICGLIQTLGNSNPDALSINLPVAEQAGISAAISIAMCLNYAVRPAPSQSFTMLGMIIPLQLSLGTWIRLQQRQPVGTPEHEQATRMIYWTITNVNHLSQTWRGPHTDVERVGPICELTAGGPLSESLYDYKRRCIRSTRWLEEKDIRYRE